MVSLPPTRWIGFRRGHPPLGSHPGVPYAQIVGTATHKELDKRPVAFQLTPNQNQTFSGRALVRRRSSIPCRPSNASSLTSLDLRSHMAPQQVSIQFGERYGHTVRTLKFGALIPRCSNEPLDSILDCEFLPTRPLPLQVLTFQGLFVSGISVQSHPLTFEWIPIVLRGVSPTVRKFTMGVVAYRLSCLDAIPWPAIDQIFAHQLQSVTIVEIFLTTPFWANRLFDNVYQDMESRLTLAAMRGVLRSSAVPECPF